MCLLTRASSPNGPCTRWRRCRRPGMLSRAHSCRRRACKLGLGYPPGRGREGRAALSGVMPRRTPGIPGDLTGFPMTRSPQRLHRVCRAGKGTWWFSSDLAGRFDLRPPEGTCYFATDANGAIREASRLGPSLRRGFRRVKSASCPDPAAHDWPRRPGKPLRVSASRTNLRPSSPVLSRNAGRRHSGRQASTGYGMYCGTTRGRGPGVCRYLVPRPRPGEGMVPATR
jgi:hypothetical protein